MTPPTKLPTHLRRVLRGGGWSTSSASFVRAAYCDDDSPSIRNSNLGFRTAQCGCRQQVLKVQP